MTQVGAFQGTVGVRRRVGGLSGRGTRTTSLSASRFGFRSSCAGFQVPHSGTKIDEAPRERLTDGCDGFGHKGEEERGRWSSWV